MNFGEEILFSSHIMLYKKISKAYWLKFPFGRFLCGADVLRDSGLASVEL